MDLSVVIPTRNKAERLALTLASLAGQTCGAGAFEVIVVADGCEDATSDVVGSYAERLQLRLLEVPWGGQSPTRNRGARAAAGRFVGFFDDDILVCPGYLQRCLEVPRRDSNVVVRAPVYTLYELRFFRDPARGVPFEQFREQVAPGSPLLRHLLDERTIREDWPAVERRFRRRNRFERLVNACLRDVPGSQQRMPWMGLSGSGVVLEKALLESVGGYDEGFGRDWGAESIELGYRLWRRGAGFVELADICSGHIDHPREHSVATFDKTFDYFFRQHRDPDIRLVQRLIWNEDDLDSALAPR